MFDHIKYGNLVMAGGQQHIAHRLHIDHIDFIIHAEYVGEGVGFRIVPEHFAIGVRAVQGFGDGVRGYFVEGWC